MNRSMKITILGTGTFYANNKQSGPGYLLEADGKKILIDCGPGTLMRLSDIGLTPDDIDYVFISHFHADHTSDLFAFQMNFRLKEFFSTDPDYKTPIIYGPPGIETFTKKLSEIYQLYAFETYSRIEYRVVQPVFEIGGITVKSFAVKHAAFRVETPAFAYRFEFGGKSFVFSGDCVKDDSIVAACADADLFICDTSSAKGQGNAAHMDTLDIGKVCAQAGVKKVVLTHFYPNLANVDVVSEVREEYQGEVVRGEDLMELEL